MVDTMHGRSFVANVLEYMLKMPREDIAGMGFSGAQFTEEQPRPESEQMGARGDAADDRRQDNRESKVEDKLNRMSFAAGEAEGVVKRVMFVVEVFEHVLHVHEAMYPVEEGVL